MTEPDNIDFDKNVSHAEAERMVEAILFSVAKPVTLSDIRNRVPFDIDIKATIARLTKIYATRGVWVVKIGDGWAFRTAPDLAFLMREEKQVVRRLSKAALETLAIIAYHQPATRTEIEEIRGVSVSQGTIHQLIKLEWVKFGQRKKTPGRPLTFVTTRHFLDHFGLESARDLPGLAELHEAGLLASEPPPVRVEETG